MFAMSHCSAGMALRYPSNRGVWCTVHRRASEHTVTCNAALYLSEVAFPAAQTLVMAAERTFWEKAAAVHALLSPATHPWGAAVKALAWVGPFG